MINKITKEQELFIQRAWKSGKFQIHKITLKNKRKVLAKWVRLGVIRQTATFDYQLDRAQYMKIYQAGNQESLF